MIDSQSIKHLSRLAQLELQPEESVEIAAQLSKALEHFQQIADISTEGIEPLITPSDIEVHFRPDEVHQEVSTEELLANAPERQGSLFKVPPVV